LLLPLQLDSLLKQALLEDLGQGDCVSEALAVLLTQQGRLHETVSLAVRARQRCVVSGLSVVLPLCQLVDKAISVTLVMSEGQLIQQGETIAVLTGALPSLLRVERTVLNFLQHLCGVATYTHQFVQKLEGLPCRLAHTRKTTPGLRLLEQQAVMAGGGFSHRFNLGDAAMLKDNLLEASGVSMQVLALTVRRRLPHTAKLEIEADTLAQVQLALEAGADVILLDNMTLEELREAIALIDKKAIVEVSGGITLETVRAYAETGADVISTSQITLGAPPIDIGLDVVK
jgi:nicotinate-nucleotide pyrophosphorylase (carboxylating)